MNPLTMLLKGFGIEINPDEVIALVRQMAADIQDMRKAIKNTEQMVTGLVHDMAVIQAGHTSEDKAASDYANGYADARLAAELQRQGKL